MGKRRNDGAPVPASEPLSNPFAALSALAAQVPVGDAPALALAPDLPREPSYSSPFCNTIVVQRERKGHGGKTVTVIRGIDAESDELEATASELQRTLGCGGHVSDGHVVLAGNQGARAAAWLKQKGAKRVIIGN